jgi:hypothetical protein
VSHLEPEPIRDGEAVMNGSEPRLTLQILRQVKAELIRAQGGGNPGLGGLSCEPRPIYIHPAGVSEFCGRRPICLKPGLI